MEMRMKIECFSKVLDEAYSSDFRVGTIRAAGDKPFSDFIDNNPQNSLKYFVRLKIPADPHGKTDYELSNGNAGDDILYKVCRGFDHYACIARRADTSSLAGKSDKKLLVTAFTMSTGKSFSQYATSQIVFESLIDIFWNGFFRVFTPCIVVFFYNVKKNRFFGPTWSIHNL